MNVHGIVLPLETRVVTAPGPSSPQLSTLGDHGIESDHDLDPDHEGR